MTEYDPISTLMEEHERFRTRLAAFAEEMRAIRARHIAPPPAVAAIRAYEEFLRRDVDGWHGRKEEQGLFPKLENYLPSGEGPIAVMLSEHALLRAQQQSIGRGTDRLGSDPEASDALDQIARAEEAVRELLTSHIEKEDHVLFPMARSVLSRAELLEVAEICSEIDREKESESTGP